MRPVHASDYFEIAVSPDSPVWVWRRTAKPFEAPEEVREEVRRLAKVLASHDTRGAAALVDLRKARGRNDAAMEQELRRLRELVHQHFHPVANIVRSAVGALHLERLNKQEGVDEGVFRDENEALAWLRGQAK